MKINEKEEIDARIKTVESRVYAGNKLAKWFNVYVRIQIFGHTIFEKTWPPQTDNEEREIS